MNARLKKGTQRFLPYILILVMAVVILWPQIQSRAFISGIDYYFHMSRTYETMMQIKTGHFSYFLSLFSWRHNARIVNAVYGPIGGYLSGLILLIVRSWYRWGIIVSFLALIIAGGTMYHLTRYWGIRRSIGVLVSFIYMTSTPLTDFVFGRTMAGFGAALVPLVFLMASEMLFEKDIQPIKLAVIMVIIIELHLMTFTLSLIVMAISFGLAVVLAKRTRLKLIEHVCEAAGLMTVLSFNAWGSILEVYHSNLHHIISTDPNAKIGTQAANTIMGRSTHLPLTQLPTLLGVMGLLIIIFVIVAWLINFRSNTVVTDLMMFFGILFIWLSSKWFPWAAVTRHFSVIISVIQFPKRFLPLGLVPFDLLTGYFLSKLTRTKRLVYVKLGGVLILLCLVAGWGLLTVNGDSQSLDHNYYQPSVIRWINMRWQVKPNPQRLRNSLHSNDPGQFIDLVSKTVSDYLPSGVNSDTPNEFNRIHPYSQYRKSFQNRFPAKWSVPKSGEEVVSWRARQEGMQTVPFAKYAHTRVTLNQQAIKPKINQVGAMILPVRKGQNRMTLRYVPSAWYKIGVWISLAAWLGLLIYVLYLMFGRYVPI